MTTLYVFIVIMASLCVWISAREPGPIVEDIVRWSPNDTKSINDYVSEIDVQQKTQTIELLKSHSSRRNLLVADKLDIALLGLGDTETVTKVFSKWWSSEEGWSWKGQLKLITETKQPHLIPWLVHDLNRNESSKPGQRGVEFFGPPKSVFAANAILKLIADSPSLQPEVREWARGVSTTLAYSDYEGRRAIVRQWWRANEKFFKR